MRTDVQVLRAVAVASVIVGHFWPNYLVGGFTGVDVFFVISGFLITSHILREATATGAINLAGFWMRRIRRILPAAVVVIATTAIAVVWIGSPDQIEILPRHVLGSSLSAENFVLGWDAVDYDRREDTTSPLQHFWSLAVEEQFYLVWPLVVAAVLVLVRRTNLFATPRTAMLTVAVSLSAASFLYAISLDPANPSTYYDPFARAWELGAGASLALWDPKRALKPASRLGTVLAVTAWLVLFGSFFLPHLDEATPGLGVVPAVLATVVIIATARPMRFRHEPVRRAVDGLTWVGDRSYSLYLWHWPVLILLPFIIAREPNSVEKVLTIALAVVLSMASYRFVEQPFRTSRRAWLHSPRKLIPLAAAITITVTAGTVAAVSLSNPAISNDEVDALIWSDSTGSVPPVLDKFTDVSPYCLGAGSAVFDCAPSESVKFGVESLSIHPPASDRCIEIDNGRFDDCVLGEIGANEKLIVIGDSHAKALWAGLDDMGSKSGVEVHLYVKNGCPFFFGTGQECLDRNRATLQRVTNGDFDAVLLTQGTTRADRITTELEDQFRVAYRELLGAGVPVAVLKDNPALTADHVTCLQREFRNPARCSIDRSEAFRNRDFAFAVATELGMSTIDLSDVYCDADSCPLLRGDVRVFRDMRHITTFFGKTMAPLLASELRRVGLISTAD